jgi:hypothetical protein
MRPDNEDQTMRALTLTCAALAAAVAMTPTDVAAQNSKYFTATVTFTDLPSSSTASVRLTDDDLGGYGNATIVTSSAGTMTLDLARANGRKLKVTLTGGVAAPGQTLPSAGTYAIVGPLVVEGVTGVTMSTGPQVRRMRLNLAGGIKDNVLAFRDDVNSAGIDVNGTPVCVTRTVSGWTVESLDPSMSCGVPPLGDLVGETAGLLNEGRGGPALRGWYVVPFSFEISCPSSPGAVCP